ncbi:MAG: RNA ligase [Candidatus Woesearchaeota archaeon]
MEISELNMFLQSIKKPILIILVGLQGCGKSTFATQLIKISNQKYTIISQDNLGRKKHLDLFNQLIDKNENIIIDRTNHTQKQRENYTTIGFNSKYHVIVINLNITFKKCVNNILKRVKEKSKHLTFNPTTYQEASEVLYRTLQEYEPPLIDECHSLINIHDFDPYCLDISDKYSQFLVIGDIHGCFDEFQELLNKFESKGYSLENTAIVSVGDLVDKGPKSKEVLEFFFNSKYSPHCYSVRGNHELKIQKYLRGNNIIISHGLEVTIKDCNLDKKSPKYDFTYNQKLLENLDSLPFMIQIAKKNYVLHAGVHPEKSLFRQPKEYLLFARTFNPITHSFNTIGDKKWYEYYTSEKPRLFFGHQEVQNTQITKNLYGLDGYCVFGGELRGAIVQTLNCEIEKIEIISTPAKKTYYQRDEFLSSNLVENLINHFKILERQGYVKSSQRNNLILFNYTQKTIYEEYWNTYTMQARGIIFDRLTNQIVARPFGKFFNINENESTQLKKLPLQESFEVFEKIDGVLGIIFYHNNRWNISTRGELNSMQAMIGENILKSKINTSKMNPNFTYICEIIHPNCKVIIDYKNEQKLILLSCINTQSGEELTYSQLEEEAVKTNFEIIKKISNFTSIEEIVAQQKIWNNTFEGVVIRFKNGLRVKVKSHSYNSLVEISLGVNSNKLLEYIQKDGTINQNFISTLPEEIKYKTIFQLEKLSSRYKKIKKEIEKDVIQIQKNLINELTLINSIKKNEFPKEKTKIQTKFLLKNLKIIGEIVYNNSRNGYLPKRLNNSISIFKHPNCIIYYIKSQHSNIDKYIKNLIRNELKLKNKKN